MKDSEGFHKQDEKINKIFCDFLEEKGFENWGYDYNKLDFCIIAYNNEDTFIPIFELHNLQDPESHSIFVKDRNGYSILLTGAIAAIYSLDVNKNWPEGEKEKRFKIMLEDVYSNYGKYDKNNRMDFSAKKMQIERKEFELEDNDNEISI